MVFSSVSDSESGPMASIVSAKSKPLHNFPHSDLKWSMNPATSHRLRRHVPDSTGKPPLRDSSAKHGEIGSENRRFRPHCPPPVAANSDFQNSAGKTLVLECAVEQKTTTANVRSKILIRFRSKSSDVPDREKQTQTPTLTPIQTPAQNPDPGAAEPQESTSKVWNLRPRRPIHKRSTPNSTTGSPTRNGVSAENRPPSACGSYHAAHIDAEDEAKEEEEERNVKFLVALSKEEIEADFLIFTGAKPPPRPKKRPRAVQKQLDGFFPGLWLVPSVSPQSYDVSNPAP